MLALALLAACDDSSPGSSAADATPIDQSFVEVVDAPAGLDAEGDAEPLADAAARDIARQDGDLRAPDADSGVDGFPVACPDPPRFDYSCDASDSPSCPEGLCAFGQCIGPQLDPERWAACGDGTCGDCEDDTLCPADCGEIPSWGPPDVADVPALTIYVHGFSSVSEEEWEETVYGDATSGGDLADMIRRFQSDVPGGQEAPEDPHQVVGVEYYGAIPADFLSEEQVAEIEALNVETHEALERYARIVAAFARHRLEATGADHINLLCHSMGCHVSRYLIENDLDGLASERRIARWTTSAGVVAGARLARLYDNPVVQEWVGILGLNTADFIHMHPDYVADHSAVWDHRLREANNPTFRGMLLHHVGGTDPKVAQAANIQLLDLNNPEDEPNDGIVFTFDELFEDQAPANRAVALSGNRLPPTRTFQYLDHFGVPDSIATGLLATASLYHARKVYLTLREVTLLDDREADDAFDFDERGTPPAEIAVEARVSYDPYVSEAFGESFWVHEETITGRTPSLREAVEGETVDLDYRVYEGPVLDEMEAITIDLEILEVDEYNRFDLHEWAFDAHERLLAFEGVVDLADAEIQLTSERLEAVLEVRVEAFYEAE